MRAWLLAFPLVTFVCFAPLAAQSKPASRPTKDKHGIEMDALSRTTLERWEAMEYHAGRRGLKSVSFTLDVVSKSPLGEAKAKGQYKFDGKKDSLKWDNPALGSMLAQRGWSAPILTRRFRGDSLRQSLKNTTLTAEKAADGSVTIHVKGETAARYKSFQYDKNGVATKFVIRVDVPNTGEVDATIRRTYDRVGKLYITNGWTFALNLPNDKLLGTVTIKNVKIGKYWLYGDVTERLTMGGAEVAKNVLTFTNHEVNGVKGATTTSKPTPQPPPKSPERTKKTGPARSEKLIGTERPDAGSHCRQLTLTSAPRHPAMTNKFEQLQAVHNAFFDNDDSNLVTMMKGFTLSALCIAAVFFFYPY